MTDDQRYIQPEVLERFLGNLFERGGMSTTDAAYCADCMVKTNLWGSIHTECFGCRSI